SLAGVPRKPANRLGVELAPMNYNSSAWAPGAVRPCDGVELLWVGLVPTRNVCSRIAAAAEGRFTTSWSFRCHSSYRLMLSPNPILQIVQSPSALLMHQGFPGTSTQPAGS